MTRRDYEVQVEWSNAPTTCATDLTLNEANEILAVYLELPTVTDARVQRSVRAQ